jgi:hypothetical protein
METRRYGGECECGHGELVAGLRVGVAADLEVAAGKVVAPGIFRLGRQRDSARGTITGAHEDNRADAAWMRRRSKFMAAEALMVVLCSCDGLFLLIWKSGVWAGRRPQRCECRRQGGCCGRCPDTKLKLRLPSVAYLHPR